MESVERETVSRPLSSPNATSHPLSGRLATDRLLVPDSAKRTVVQRQDIFTLLEPIDNSIATCGLRSRYRNGSEQ